MKQKQLVEQKIAPKEQAKRIKNHPFIVPVVTFLFLFGLSLVSYVAAKGRTTQPSDARVVILSYDDKQETLPTRAETVGEFLDNTDISLKQGDVVEPSRDTPIAEDNLKVNIHRARPVIIIDGQRKIQAQSAATTPRSVAQQVGVTIYPEDDVTTSPTTNFLKDGIGEQIIIDRSTPINLNIYGTALIARTRAKTVGDLLNEKQITLAQDDIVQPAKDVALAPNLQIFITRKGVQIVTEEKTTPAPVEVIEDSSLSTGASAVRQQGSPGKKLITYQIDLENDKEVSRRVIQEVVVQQPVKQIVARGPLGSFGDALARLRSCEAGGNYANKKNPVYRGAYQFNYSTWANYAGFYDPADAPPAIQDEKASETYRRRGWQPWPACSVKLGLQDIYR